MEDDREFQSDFEPATLDGTSTTRRPDAVSLDYLRAFSLGPVAVQDPTEGVFNYVWRMRVDNAAGEVYLARETDAGDGWKTEVLRFSFDPADPILEADLAWNQNADPVIVAERATGSGGGPEVWIHFFDPVAGATTFTSFGEGRTPRTLLDNPRDPPTSDVLVFYFNDTAGDLVYRKQADRYDTEYVTGLGASADRFVEEVMKRRDSRLEVAYAEHDSAAGTYSLASIVSALYPYAMEEEGVEPAQEPLSAAVAQVILDVIATTQDPSNFGEISGFTDTDGVRPAQEPLGAVVNSIIDWVLAGSDDPADFTGDVLGFSGAEGVQAAQEPLAAVVEDVIIQVIADTEDPSAFDIVHGYTQTEGVKPAQEPLSAIVERVIITAYNQPIEGVQAAQEPMSGQAARPLPVTSNLVVHLRGHDLVLVDGDPVVEWPGASDTAYDASQATGSKQPTYKSNILNGYPVVRFDGTDDVLLTGLFASALSQPTTIFLVAAVHSTSGGSYVFTDGETNRQQMKAQDHDSDSRVEWRMWADFPNLDGPEPGTAFRIYVGIFNGTNSLGRMDGLEEMNGEVGTNALDRLVLGSDEPAGGSSFLDGDIAEVGVYQAALSSSEIDQVEGYLADKYGITLP